MLEGANHFGIPLRDANKKKSKFKGDVSGPLKGFATDTLFRGRWGANEKNGAQFSGTSGKRGRRVRAVC